MREAAGPSPVARTTHRLQRELALSDAVCATPVAQVRFKGTMLTCTVLEISQYTRDAFAGAVRDHVAQAPDFFRAVPALLSFVQYDGELDALPVQELLAICREAALPVIGLRGGDPACEALAQRAGLPLLPMIESRGRPAQSAPAAAPSAPPAADPPAAATRIIRQPVRSGQQVVAADGDLIVMAPVSAGAEVLAAGNIHTYAPLRGRALAGIRGDTQARIFCQSLEAELVSIAGCYRAIEPHPESGWKQGVVIELFGDQLVVHPLPMARPGA